MSKTVFRMAHFEAYAFLPHLIGKLGESRQEVRDTVHDLLRSMVYLYSNIKVFESVLDGAKSKNSRSRTECLKHCGDMIEKHGMEVVGPPKQAALKDIASQISDRDQNVRSAALNALVNVYNIIGEDVYNPKKIGRLGEKEESYLKERIKRAGGSNPNATANVNGTKQIGPRDGTIIRGKRADSKTRRGTMTLGKVGAPEGIKRTETPEAITPPTPEPEGRFNIPEPEPAKTIIQPLKLTTVEVDHIFDPIPEVEYKYKSTASSCQEKTKMALDELNIYAGACKVHINTVVEDIQLQLASNETDRIAQALVLAVRILKRKPVMLGKAIVA